MNSRQERSLLLETAPLPRASDTVAALIVLDDSRYVMQLRDSRTDIFYPDHWGCFGGGVDRDEQPLEALKRELYEELELQIESAVEFTRFDFSRLGQRKVYRIYYEVRIPGPAVEGFVLHEGVAVEAISGEELVTDRKVAPYDQFAVWLHMKGGRA